MGRTFPDFVDTREPARKAPATPWWSRMAQHP